MVVGYCTNAFYLLSSVVSGLICFLFDAGKAFFYVSSKIGECIALLVVTLFKYLFTQTYVDQADEYYLFTQTYVDQADEYLQRTDRLGECRRIPGSTNVLLYLLTPFDSVTNLLVYIIDGILTGIRGVIGFFKVIAAFLEDPWKSLMHLKNLLVFLFEGILTGVRAIIILIHYVFQNYCMSLLLTFFCFVCATLVGVDLFKYIRSKMPRAVQFSSFALDYLVGIVHGRIGNLLQKKRVSSVSVGDIITELERVKASHLCIICLERPRNIILTGCKHLIMCSQCAEFICSTNRKPTCPICRYPIEDYWPVYT